MDRSSLGGPRGYCNHGDNYDENNENNNSLLPPKTSFFPPSWIFPFPKMAREKRLASTPSSSSNNKKQKVEPAPAPINGVSAVSILGKVIAGSSYLSKENIGSRNYLYLHKLTLFRIIEHLS